MCVCVCVGGEYVIYVVDRHAYTLADCALLLYLNEDEVMDSVSDCVVIYNADW